MVEFPNDCCCYYYLRHSMLKPYLPPYVCLFVFYWISTLTHSCKLYVVLIDFGLMTFLSDDIIERCFFLYRFFFFAELFKVSIYHYHRLQYIFFFFHTYDIRFKLMKFFFVRFKVNDESQRCDRFKHKTLTVTIDKISHFENLQNERKKKERIPYTQFFPFNTYTFFVIIIWCTLYLKPMWIVACIIYCFAFDLDWCKTCATSAIIASTTARSATESGIY